MSVAGDTLYAASVHTADACYKLRKYLFPVSDTVRFGNASAEMLYKDAATVQTPAGSFANNTVYKDSQVLTMYFHEGVGLIRVEFRTGTGMLHRSLTLKTYKVE